VTDEFQMFVPTAFTPTNDDRNEVFKPIIHGFNGNKYNFKIFDRWGVKIFETNNYEEPWIGNINGGDYYAQEDVYVWLVLVTDKYGNEHKAQGHVTLVR
jgi:gliding motility-associated-like protein